jgi:multimeric flavodoxin WrbA
MPDPQLDEAEFKRRYRAQFYDPAFRAHDVQIDALAETAWQAYADGRKAPVTRRAGEGFHDPDYELSVEWLAAREAVLEAARLNEDKAAPASILVVNGSSRSEHTCPGEMSKSFRLTQIAREAISAYGRFDIQLLDLSRLASEYGRRIHPCKACFSTSPALCHWPCSCYPNHSLGQVHDWMNDIYPLWVRAHGIMVVTPVNWYHSSSPIKLMIDRLVCADGGNPDPTLTHGKTAEEAKRVELEGWSYPRHLAGRLFSVVAHGDVEGAENVRRSLSDWLKFMQLQPAGPKAEIDRYIGYWKPYATSHNELDQDTDMQEEMRNAARTLAEAVLAKRDGRWVSAGAELQSPRQK